MLHVVREYAEQLLLTASVHMLSCAETEMLVILFPILYIQRTNSTRRRSFNLKYSHGHVYLSSQVWHERTCAR